MTMKTIAFLFLTLFALVTFPEIVVPFVTVVGGSYLAWEVLYGKQGIKQWGDLIDKKWWERFGAGMSKRWS